VQNGKPLFAAISVGTTAGAVILLGLLMAAHMPYGSELAAASLTQRSTGRWRAVYILGAECPCSRRVARHLAESPRLHDIEELVVFVGQDSAIESSLEHANLKLDRKSGPEARELYGARSAPLLVFVDPSGAIRYSGGFARRNDFRDGFQETRVWAALREARAVETLPAFGCALPEKPAARGVRAVLGL